MRRSGLACLAALGLAACASTGPVRSATSATNAIPYAQIPYANVAPAPLHGEMLACNGGGGANVGPVGARGEVVAYTPYLYSPVGPLLRNPTEAACLASGFGLRGAADGGGRQHNGLDLANREGGYIYAAAAGRVRRVDWLGAYGLTIDIDHGEGVFTRYAHLSEIDANLRPGAFVSAGAPIARMGATGNATGVHLHYEVTVDGLIVDPLHFGVSAPVAGS
jgi:murein DD-endopeptidase MepM/ murein hydrolase activator NlpD